jgi:Family of unknown function (DUF6338)
VKIDVLILQLAILFLPGLIWAKLDARYTPKPKASDIEFFLRAFLFGVATYGIIFLIYSALGWPFTIINLADAGTQSVVTPAVLKEVLAATVLGFLLSIVWIYGSTYKWLTRFLQKIKATKTYGDEDVWDFTFNSSVAAVEYVHFRDFENKFVYAGWVMTFSETEKLRELVLRDVQVFDFEGVLQYETPLLYLARNAENIHIEFPYRGRAASGSAPATGEGDTT